MLKIASVCAALILAGAAFSTSAEARFGGGGGHVGGFGGHVGGFGGHVGSFGGHVGGFSGARMGSFSGARIGSFSGARIGSFSGARFSGARVGTFSGARVGAVHYGGARIATYGGRGFYRGGYVGPGRYAYGYRYGRYGYRYGRYWPWGLGVGALAVASAWPYYSNYGYADYGYDSCYQLRRMWTPYGWRWAQVNVCGYSGYNYDY